MSGAFASAQAQREFDATYNPEYVAGPHGGLINYATHFVDPYTGAYEKKYPGWEQRVADGEAHKLNSVSNYYVNGAEVTKAQYDAGGYVAPAPDTAEITALRATAAAADAARANAARLPVLGGTRTNPTIDGKPVARILTRDQMTLNANRAVSEAIEDADESVARLRAPGYVASEDKVQHLPTNETVAAAPRDMKKIAIAIAVVVVLVVVAVALYRSSSSKS